MSYLSLWTEICSLHKCKYQGEQCLVHETTTKPYCKCIAQCSSEKKPVCGKDTGDVSSISQKKTFISRCVMDREACEKKRMILMQYEGHCQFKRKTRKQVINYFLQFIWNLISVNSLSWTYLHSSVGFWTFDSNDLGETFNLNSIPLWLTAVGIRPQNVAVLVRARILYTLPIGNYGKFIMRNCKGLSGIKGKMLINYKIFNSINHLSNPFDSIVDKDLLAFLC